LAPRRGTTLKKNLRAIEHAFAEIERSLAHLSTRVRRAAREAVKKAGPARAKRRTLHLTPKRRAQLKLQGAYMGYMRQLKPAQQAEIRAMKAKRGFEAAIRAARKLAVR
jgi:hypothetical protein